MAAGWPTKANYATGDVLSATNMNDLSGTVNYIDPTSATDGQVLTRDAASAGKVKWATSSSGSTYVAGKNAILNSNFSVWQRGTSFNPNTSTYSADRWACTRGVTGSTISRQTTSDTTNLPNIQYCARVARDSGNTATNTIYLSQSLENVNSTPFIGQTYTVSFWARKGANMTANLDFYLGAGTGTDQNILNTWTGNTYYTNQSIALTTTWTRYSYSSTIATSKTQIGVTFGYSPTATTAGAADYFEVTGVQLEIASSASAYSPNAATFQGELAACQRYYFKDGKVVGQDGYAQTATTIYFKYYHPVPMRTTPTYTQTGGASFSSNTSATTFSTDANGSNELSTNFYFLVGASTGYTYLYRPVEWSAEL